jgi:hypothetical protein
MICPILILATISSPPVDFVRDIRPILSQHCFACHGPNEESRKAGLSFVTFDSATAERDPGIFAVVPGRRLESELWHRINDAIDPMPPAEEHHALSAEQVELLGRWIDDGASYAPHWAYVPPQATTDHPSIDAWLDARLNAEALEASPPALPTSLFRRVHLDLTGLPPTTADLDAFMASPTQEAYDTTVDSLLASPHFGERMAIFWLDLVRYADTVGYHGDQTHRIWPYRDWVINAFNLNTPFDTFTIAQLAGDLLPEPTQEDLIATGYNRLVQTTHEGGAQLKEYRAIYMSDRVRNFSEAWMGATVGCAECHDHKYDPYSARDFHTLGAFFADVDDEEHLRNQYGGLNTLPTRRLPEMRVVSNDAQATLALFAQRLQEIDATEDPVATADIEHIIWIDDTLDTGGKADGDWSFRVVPGVAAHSGDVYRRQTSSGLIQHYTVDTDKKSITVQPGDTLYAWVYLDPASPPNAVMLQCNTKGDWDHRAVWGDDSIAYGRTPTNTNSYQRRGDLPPLGQWTKLAVPFETLGLPAGSVITGIAFSQFGGTVLWDDCGAERDQAQQVKATALESLRAEQATFEAALPKTLYTQALEEPRVVRVLHRGNWLDETGEIVEPAVPAFLGTLETTHRATRLDLAHWLTSQEEDKGVGGLTARVFVNRIWAMLFGTGLCPSVGDFGGQGSPPVHRELLDAIALQFIASGWDIKALIRTLVSTEAYQRSSIPTTTAFELDPENLLYARQSRFRLPAEFVRDTLLATSGILNSAIGGPSIKPPQPSGYYRHLNFPTRKYSADTSQEQWRRGLYVHWQRQFLHPMLLAFDAPVRDNCTAERSKSNTPTAALVLLNDPIFVEAAIAFATRILEEDLPLDRSRIAFAFREATSRHGTKAELEILETLLASSRVAFEAAPDTASKFLALSNQLPSMAFEEEELAAWSQVTRAILNTHEAINRD